MSQRQGGHQQRQPPPSVQQPAPPRSVRRGRSRGRVLLATLGAIILVFVVVVVETGRGHQGPPLPSALHEDLRLSGEVNGRLTTATAIEGMTTTFPPQQGQYGLGRVNETACVRNSGEGWEVDLYGKVGAHMLSLSFDGDDLNGDDESVDYVGMHDIDNSASSGGLVALYWGSQDLEFPQPLSAKLKVNRNGTSGTMDIKFASGPQGGSTVETVKGSWRCA
jgi:hypothetical protein